MTMVVLEYICGCTSCTRHVSIIRTNAKHELFLLYLSISLMKQSRNISQTIKPKTLSVAFHGIDIFGVLIAHILQTVVHILHIVLEVGQILQCCPAVLWNRNDLSFRSSCGLEVITGAQVLNLVVGVGFDHGRNFFNFPYFKDLLLLALNAPFLSLGACLCLVFFARSFAALYSSGDLLRLLNRGSFLRCLLRFALGCVLFWRIGLSSR
mmetsp:Transcript_7216/g.11421  ORF Transcript_7216/g.11421 Transcript_7216/m.11421 type:complete len:209 (-) Transcript_7216:104-730(-)